MRFTLLTTPLFALGALGASVLHRRELLHPSSNVTLIFPQDKMNTTLPVEIGFSNMQVGLGIKSKVTIDLKYPDGSQMPVNPDDVQDSCTEGRVIENKGSSHSMLLNATGV
jgi:hypothetical protein